MKSTTSFALLKSIRELELYNRPVFLRLDLNVPLSEPDASGKRTIEDDTRITEALPTIKFAVEKGAKLVLASHLGRPKGKPTPEYSLLPVATRLAELLDKDVTLTDDCIGEGIELMVKTMASGQIILLENLRFHKEEEANNLEFSQKLARLCDIYVNDAFGAAHRKHASTFGIAECVPIKAIGFLIEKELSALERLLDKPERPFYTILGGSKVTDKIATIESLLKNVQGVLIGGAMAHAFWRATNRTVPDGAKQPSQDDIDAAKKVIALAKNKDIPLLIPSDTNLGFDIGPETTAEFCTFLKKAKTVFWNGPLGWFEKPEYATGTFEVAKALSEISAYKVVGGGDTVSAVKQSGFSDKFEHLSTGGGATLEYLEGRGLPGIDVLKK